MRTIQSTVSIAGRTDRLTSRAMAALQSAWLGFWQWWSLRATILLLQELDDRMLKDIGIDRSEIESIAHTQGFECLRRYDALNGAVRRL
jgi:uncharacterized protein YjiS (DUF1127 family)